MTIRLRRHGRPRTVREEASGTQRPRDILEKRLALATEMLTLAVLDDTTLPPAQVEALREVLRRLVRVQAYCASHPQGEDNV